MKSAGKAGSGSTVSSVASAPVAGDVGESTVEKHPSSGAMESAKSWSHSPSFGRKSWRARLRICGLSWSPSGANEGSLSRMGSEHRACLEGDVHSLTEATAFHEAELKAEGPKAVAAYKASRGFESGLKKMGRVKYEFGYRVVLERLRGKHSEMTIERDPFVECPKDANVEMDLDQPFEARYLYGNGTI
ncbi:hypothetical protein BHM03_00025260 [Ensete ventricosum]|nr:hypothetical protein BHM03_00025260 [Ensete ventricosum]